VKRSHLIVFLALVTLIVSFHMGLRFALIDQQVQLPSIYKRMDSSLFSRDFIFQTAGTFGPRYFVYALLVFLVKLFPVEWLSFVMVLLINFLMLWITYRVTEELFPRVKLAPLLSVVLVGSLGSSIIPIAPIITQEMDPRAMGMPLALLCLWAALRGKPMLSTVIGLIGSLIHPTLLINTMLIAYAGLGLSWLAGLFTRGRVGSQRLVSDFFWIAGSAALFAGVSYMLWMVRYDISGIDNKMLFEMLQFRTPRSYALLAFWGAKRFFLTGLFLIGVFWAWRWWYKDALKDKRDAFIPLGLLAGTVIMLSGGILFVEFIHSRIWLSFDASSGFFILRWIGLIFMARSAAFLIDRSEAEPLSVANAAVLMMGSGPALTAFGVLGHGMETLRRKLTRILNPSALAICLVIGFIFAALLMVGAGSLRDSVALLLSGLAALWFIVIPEKRFRAVVAAAAACALIIVVMAANGKIPGDRLYKTTSLFHQVIKPADAHNLPEDGNKFAAIDDVSLYARNHTAKNALFLTPPFGSHFRFMSLRSIVVDFKGMPATSKGMMEWRHRLEDCYGLSRQLGFSALDDMDRNYHAISRTTLREIRRKYGPDYAFLYADSPAEGLPVLHANKLYRLVDLKPLDEDL